MPSPRAEAPPAGVPLLGAPSADVAPVGPEVQPASRLPGPGAFDPGRRGVRALAVV
ncbi:ComEA family DNA-binding protein, partial [Micromonospora sp. STR1_7]|nr:ComEA family DNA-binding protein [Micromonospora parastrephiae]